MDLKKQLRSIAVIIIAVVSIGHLIFTNIHVRALLLLEHELCGFFMFAFILMGLVSLFEATRIKEKEVKIKIFTALSCFFTSAIGAYLINVYLNAIANQRALDIPVVNRALMLSIGIVVAYVLSGILLIIDSVKNK